MIKTTINVRRCILRAFYGQETAVQLLSEKETNIEEEDRDGVQRCISGQ